MTWALWIGLALAVDSPPADVPAAPPAVTATPALAVPEALLAPGAVLTWAVEKGDAAGNDYEFVITLTSVDGPLVYDWRMGPPKDESGSRTVEARWREGATLVDNQYRPGKKPRFASTSLALSTVMLTKARAGEPQTIAVVGAPARQIVSTKRVPFEVFLDDASVSVPALALTDADGGVTTVLDDDGLPLILAVDAVHHTRLVNVSGGDPTVREALDGDGTLTSYGVRFEVGSAQLTPESEGVLTEVREWLAENPTKTLRIDGHTDAVGSDASNRTLSEARAEAVRTWLVDHGADGARLKAVGLGESAPVAPNTTLAGRAQNRRVVFTVE